MIKCRECRTKVSSFADICPKCGIGIRGYQQAPPIKTYSRNTKIFWGIVAVVLAAVVTESMESYEREHGRPAISITTKSEQIDKVILSNANIEKLLGGSMFQLTGVIYNGNGFTVKDLEITCEHVSPSGTKIDSNRRVIYQSVPGESSLQIKDFDMGFIHSQVVRSDCKVTDFQR